MSDDDTGNVEVARSKRWIYLDSLEALIFATL